MDKKTLKDINITGKRVLVRVDYNVPTDDNGAITDDTRITASLPTLHYLLDNGAAVVIMAHFGRPKGKANPKYSLRFIVDYLSKLINRPVQFADSCIGEQAVGLSEAMKPGDVLLLENLRFHSEEEDNDLDFAEDLATLADIYVNDGFGVSHRAHASVEAITYFLPSVAGMLLEKEIKFVGQAVEAPQRPFAAIIGGAKVSDKIAVIDNLIDKVDLLIIGGGMANTFLAAEGFELGKSLVESEKYELAKSLITKADKKGIKMLLPVDMVVADSFSPTAEYKVCDISAIPQDWMALDIGPKSREIFATALKDMKQIVWNGPMGVFEMDAFCGGTEAVAKAVAAADAISIVGGGDSVAAIEKLGLADQITHISTGGGASLEYLEGKILPGIEAIDDIRKPMIAGNWKMHKTVTESVQLAKDIVRLTSGAMPEVVIFPAFTALESVAYAIDGHHVGYGGQNMHHEVQGAFTGEISGKMLADIGCEYVLIGHSERRHVFGETDEMMLKKVQAALAFGLKPVLCVGEKLDERKAGAMQTVVAAQLSVLQAFETQELLDLVVAYEPVWAIGTGENASREQAGEACTYIRSWLREHCSELVARNVRILYGGSVKADNAGSFMQEADVDGLLVGGASLEAESFAKIVRY